MIWSSKSFIPRSATLNLTFDLFGESMNLFEMGGRVEGLETLFESYFGPNGYYNNKDKDSNKIPEADPLAARLSTKKFNDIKKQVRSAEVHVWFCTHHNQSFEGVYRNYPVRPYFL